MNNWNKLADKQIIDKTVEALKANGIDAKVVAKGEEAKKEVLSLIPEGAEVLTQTSMTLQAIGILQDLHESGKFDSVRNKLNSMNRKTQNLEMQKLGGGPDWTIGSVHAVSEDGHVFIASNTGSQLSAYVGGASHVIWVVGTQKIVKNDAEALKRIYEYVLPLEKDRARKAYGVSGSNVSKLLFVNREVKQDRITLIFVNEVLGF